MSHPSHRDHINAFNAKRAPQDLADEEASHIQELLEAAQKQEQEKPVYKDGSYEQD